MMKLKKEHCEKIRQSIISKINCYVIESCYIINDTYNRHGEKIPNDENKIRNILLQEALNNDENRKKFDMYNYRFDSEVPEKYNSNTKTYKGRVDIRVIHKEDYFESSEKYYIIECKRIDGNLVLNKKFVDEGVCRFLDGKYSLYYGQATMIGFIVKKGVEMENNYLNIIKYQNSNNLSSTEIYNSSRDLHYSAIRHFDNDQINIEYLFFDFSNVIK